jgi:NAD(P)-dependent dehydrogenase (short-subunit alcohol dehydrogenase family)
MNFKNKHAVITGGSNGIGRCIAQSFLREGAAVTVIDIDENSPANAQFYHGDIADKPTLEAFAASLKQPVDFLINNACISRKGLLSVCTYEDFEYVQRVGVTAPYYLTSLLLQKNLLASNASIINIASTRAFQSHPDTEAYTAAKGGIIALTHAMAISLSGKARVNSISPGWIDRRAAGGNICESPELSEEDHRRHPSGRVGVPEDIAGLVLYLCSDRAGFITGENIIVDGGMSRQMIYHGDCGWSLS